MKSLFNLCIIFLVIICCKNDIRKKQSKEINYTLKDTIYILFDDNYKKVSRFKKLIYKPKNQHVSKYYYITYDFPVYWQETVTKERAESEYGKEYVKKYGIRSQDFFLYEGYYDHSFWFGTYKVIPEYPEFDDSKIFGNSQIIKKHKSFLKIKKKQIIDYNWLLERTPPEVWDLFKFQQKNKPIIFIIDKDEFSKDSIVLRNVIYHGETIE